MEVFKAKAFKDITTPGCLGQLRTNISFSQYFSPGQPSRYDLTKLRRLGFCELPSSLVALWYDSIPKCKQVAFLCVFTEERVESDSLTHYKGSRPLMKTWTLLSDPQRFHVYVLPNGVQKIKIIQLLA